MPRRVVSSAPTRIDLAGGTVDLWPLYLLHRRPLTVNAAINLDATATVEEWPGPGHEIVSRDRGVSWRVPPGATLEEALAECPAELAFPLRLTLNLLASPAGRVPETGGVRVITDCRAPAGSGLGGSSALGVALSAALDRFAGRAFDPGRLLQVTRAIETQVLAIPSGEQDYHPALRGGVLGIHYGVEGTRLERLDVAVGDLRRRLVLTYTGVSRSSGLSNWDIFKRHLDGDAEVRSALQATSDAAHEMRRALLAADWDGAADALEREWVARQRLSPAVTDARIDRLIACARSAGARGGKVCGAGGGGCLVLWVDEGRSGAVEDALAREGALVLPFAFSDSGVRLTES